MTSADDRDDVRRRSAAATDDGQRDISAASADRALPDAEGVAPPKIDDLETEGATQAFAVPKAPPFMQGSAANGDDALEDDETE